MKVSFRQGIISHQTGAFLSINGSGNVDLLATNIDLNVTIAQKSANYLFIETSTTLDAWVGPFSAGTTYWLYWDFNVLTFNRTFGYTTLAPIFQPSEPVTPVEGLMWFDTSTNTHYAYTAGNFIEVIRVFTAVLTGGNVFTGMGTDAFVGTQIGDITEHFAGVILFDELGQPIVRSNNTFITTENQFFSETSMVRSIRLESNVERATAVANVGAYTGVTFDSFGKIITADYDNIGNSVIGLSTESLLAGEVGSVILQGVVHNVDWTWQTVGDELWIDNSGVLVLTDPHVSDPITYPTARVPVGRVLSPTSIIFEQGLGGVGDRGPAGLDAGVPIATTSVLGKVKLTTPPADADNPKVATDTDPRLTDSRVALPHGHLASEISVIPTGGILSTNAQAAFEELATNTRSVVRVSTTVDIGGVYAPTGGAGGTGSFSNVDLTNIDGIVDISALEKILLKDQSDAKQNGIYSVVISGASGSLERSPDHDGNPASEITPGVVAYVTEGTLNVGVIYMLIGGNTTGAGNTFVVNTDDLNWQAITAQNVDHTLLLNIGTNTHDQIDTHITKTHNTSNDNPHGLPLDKVDATAAPTVNDDNTNTSSNGIFAVGSSWIDITNDKIYICVDATSTAAIWNEQGAPVALALNDLTDVTISALTGDEILQYNDTNSQWEATELTGGLAGFNVQTGTSYTIVAGDNGVPIAFTNSSPIAVAINSGLPVDFQCTVYQLGTGIITVTQPFLQNMNGGPGPKTSAGQWSYVKIGQYSATNWFGIDGWDEYLPKSALNKVVTTTATTLSSADNGSIIHMNNASSNSVTISDTLPVDFQCTVVQVGSGITTVDVEGKIDTLNGTSAGTGLTPSDQYKAVYVTQISEGVWIGVD